LRLRLEIGGLPGTQRDAGLIGAATETDVELKIADGDLMCPRIEMTDDETIRRARSNSLAIDGILRLDREAER
jgi:hypothetical protein